jgi:hypothetical protein
VCVTVKSGAKEHFKKVYDLLVAAKTFIYKDTTKFGVIKTSALQIVKSRLLSAYEDVKQGNLLSALKKSLGVGSESDIKANERLFQDVKAPSILAFPNSPFTIISKS